MASSKSEQSFVQASLLADTPARADGRALLDYRPIALETGVAPLANGSARVSIGGVGLNGVGGGLPGTEVLAAVKLEVMDIKDEGWVNGGRISSAVSCSPSAYPNLNSNALDDLQSDLSILLDQTFSHPSLRPPNLSIIPGKKAWLLHLDVLILCNCGNTYDAVFLASTAALRDTRVPRTRGVQYRPPVGGGIGSSSSTDDVHMRDIASSGLDTRSQKKSTDFELTDYWDEGEPLTNAEHFPICVTLNMITSIHYLDATSPEESATSLRLLLILAFPNVSSNSPSSTKSRLQGMKLLGHGETNTQHLKILIRQGEEYAQNLKHGLDAKLKSEAMRRNIHGSKR